MSGAHGAPTFAGLVVCGGDPPSQRLLLTEEARADLVVYTDGAAASPGARGRRIDVVIGDFDSLVEPMPDCQIVNAGPHELQMDSDSEKAVRYVISTAAELGFHGRDRVAVRVLGAAGGRIDHTLANVLVCARYEEEASLRLVADDWELWVAMGRRPLGLPPGTSVSLLPLASPVRVTTQGLRWPLDELVEYGSRGLSNEVLTEDAAIEVTGGPVAVVAIRGRRSG